MSVGASKLHCTLQSERRGGEVQSEGSLDTDEEEGKDWDELEDEARRSDKLRYEQEDDGGDASRKRKGGGGGGRLGRPTKKQR